MPGRVQAIGAGEHIELVPGIGELHATWHGTPDCAAEGSNSSAWYVSGAVAIPSSDRLSDEAASRSGEHTQRVSSWQPATYEISL